MKIVILLALLLSGCTTLEAQRWGRAAQAFSQSTAGMQPAYAAPVVVVPAHPTTCMAMGGGMLACR